MKEETYNIIFPFVLRASEEPERTAIVYNGQSVSYSQLYAEIQSDAGYFVSKGICKGDRVMVFIPMSMDLYRTILALFYIGAVVVFLDEWVGIKRMEECCKVAQCKAFIGGWKIKAIAIFSKELKKIPLKFGLSQKRQHISPTMEQMSPGDTALITFTTGSTGLPKAAKRTHGFLKSQFLALVDVLKPQRDDVDMPTLPIVLLINLGIGCTSVIPSYKSSKPQSLDPGKIWEQVKKYKVNRITASPYFIKKLSEYITENKYDTSFVKKIFTGGAPVFPTEAFVIRKAFPATSIIIVYGSTEAEPISTINADELIKTLSKFLRVGTPYKTIHVKILPFFANPITVANKTEFESLALSNGEIGEIAVSGPHVLAEYFNSDEAFKRNKIVIDNEIWHRTGDAGRINEKGELELAGRCEMIIKQGNNSWYPFIFENKCLDIVGVTSGAMIQINNAVYVVIETADKQMRPEIRRQIINMIPEKAKIILIKDMPRDLRHFSKIDYNSLAGLIRQNR